MSSAVDVCEGCRRLRKRCDKDNCVLHPCLESLWPSNRQSQGNATVFLAKYFGRKRFFKLLEAVTSQQRATVFESLMQEACGRTMNPIGGATGLYKLGRWAECETAVTRVLNGESLRPVVVDAPCTPTAIRNVVQAEEPAQMIQSDDPAEEPVEMIHRNDLIDQPVEIIQKQGLVQEPVEMIHRDDPVDDPLKMFQNDDRVQLEPLQMPQNDGPVEEQSAVLASGV